MREEGLDLQTRAELALEDVHRILISHEGNGLPPGDSDCALSAYYADLRNLLQVYKDEEASKQLEEADKAIQAAIAEVGAEELQANQDRVIARQLAGLAPEAPLHVAEGLQDGLPDPSTGLLVATPLKVASETSKALTRMISLLWQAEELTYQVDCVSCASKTSIGKVETECDHNYCDECLTNLVDHATRDEELHPIRCCKKPMDIDQMELFLPTGALDLYKEKTIEYSTEDRVYCSDPTCSTFINPEQIENHIHIALCNKCGKSTCCLCKKEYHLGKCPLDTVDNELLELAAANGWMRCYKCGTVIQLIHGCSHMT